jgi:hypothetical protein
LIGNILLTPLGGQWGNGVGMIIIIIRVVEESVISFVAIGVTIVIA